MKKTFFIFVSVVLAVALFGLSAKAQECESFERLMQEGNAALTQKNPDYKKAVDKFTAAWRDCPPKSALAREAIVKVFDEINSLKDNALRQEKLAREALDKTQQLVDILMPIEAEKDPFGYFWKKAKTELKSFRYTEAYKAVFLASDARNKPAEKNDSIKKLFAQAEWYNDRYKKALGYFYSNQFEQAKPLFWDIYKRNPADSLCLFYYKACHTPGTLDMVSVKGGLFMMGDSTINKDEKPVHKVQLTDFEIGAYEVTHAQYARFLNEWAKDFPTAQIADTLDKFIYLDGRNDAYMLCGIYAEGAIYKVLHGYENRPVAWVSWYGAQAFCNFYKSNKLSLPSEAQWEYAAGGGNNTEYVETRRGASLRTKYAGTDSTSLLGDYAWYSENSSSRTHGVGSKKPNQLGIYDMSGNLWEWCADWYSSSFYQQCHEKGTVTNPIYLEDAGFRILRGGSWSSYDEDCRTAYRVSNYPYGRNDYYGFRVLRNK